MFSANFYDLNEFTHNASHSGHHLRLIKDHKALSRQIQQTRKSAQNPCHINQHANTSPEVTQALSTHKCVNTRKPRPTAAATHAPSPSSQTAATTHRRPASNAQVQDRHHHRSSPTPSAGPACKRRWARSSFAISYLASLWSRRRRNLMLSTVARIGWMSTGVSVR